MRVQQLSNNLLACSTFTGDQHRHIHPRNAQQLFVQLLHRRSGGQKKLSSAQLLAQQLGLWFFYRSCAPVAWPA